MTITDRALSFFSRAFSERGEPSSSRIISGWLSVSSMALLWFIVRHTVDLPTEKLQVWVGGLPAIIVALGGFTVAPYGVSSFTSIFKKDNITEKDKE